MQSFLHDFFAHTGNLDLPGDFLLGNKKQPSPHRFNIAARSFPFLGDDFAHPFVKGLFRRRDELNDAFLAVELDDVLDIFPFLF